jgi:hypothetical protein
MPNVRGFVNVLLGGRIGPRYLTIVEVAVSLALLSWPILKWSRHGWNSDSKAFDLLFSLTVVVCAMVSHHSLINAPLVLTLPALLLLDRAAEAYPPGLRRWRLTASLILMLPITIFLNVEVRNKLAFLFPVILWFAFTISGEIPKSSGKAGGGELGSA